MWCLLPDATDHGLDVVVEGVATRTTDNQLLRQLVDVWAKKWDGQWKYEVHNGFLRRRILAFGKGTFSQTRYRF
jgi:hypothetical protein